MELVGSIGADDVEHSCFAFSCRLQSVAEIRWLQKVADDVLP